MKYFPQQKNTGFTLIELLVSVSIFTVVMLIAISSLISINGANRKTQAIRTVTDSMHFALENMTRSMRLGIDYHCVSGTPQDCSAIEFLAPDLVTQIPNRPTVYSVVLPGHQLIRVDRTSGKSVVLTPPEVNITEMRFTIFNDSQSQPKVAVFMSGEIEVLGEKTTFAVQTLVSQRQFK